MLKMTLIVFLCSLIVLRISLFGDLKLKRKQKKKVANTDKQKDEVYKDKLRDEIIEEEIRGNKSLELLYDWSKFYMMVDESKGKLRSIND